MTEPPRPLSRLARTVISLLVSGHLLAVVLPPLAFQTRGPLGTSPSVAMLFDRFEGYCQFLYLDRGYAFFAPDPGPSHLVQAAITDREGDQVERMIPSLDDQWPRLLYHRHFMLTEFLEEIYQPPGPPQELVEGDPAEARQWRLARSRYEHVRKSFVEHLRHEYPQQTVAIRRIEHVLPEVLEFQASPIELTDPVFYRVLLDQPVDTPTVPPLLPPQQATETVPVPSPVGLDAPNGRAGKGRAGPLPTQNRVREPAGGPGGSQMLQSEVVPETESP